MNDRTPNCRSCGRSGHFVRTRRFPDADARVWECRNPQCASRGLIWHTSAPHTGTVWQTANDLICRSPEEFAHWIAIFNVAGKPEQAVILEAQQFILDPTD